jgi:hypothetical protein
VLDLKGQPERSMHHEYPHVVQVNQTTGSAATSITFAVVPLHIGHGGAAAISRPCDLSGRGACFGTRRSEAVAVGVSCSASAARCVSAVILARRDALAATVSRALNTALTRARRSSTERNSK